MNPLNPQKPAVSIKPTSELSGNQSSPTSWKKLIGQSPLPLLETRALIEKASGRPRTWLLANDTSSVPNSVLIAYHELLQRRLQGEPLAYITQEREFYGLTFAVTAAVLIPRADTEVLVDYAVQHLRPNAQVLELGTGSGCIAIAAAKNRPDSRWLAIDVSCDAILVAQQNAARHGLETQIEFRESDWFSAIDPNVQFDAIISNPPYIAAQDHHLSEGDLPFEPTRALTDFGDGYSAIRAIALGAREYLRAQGLLLIEHGFDQGKAVRDLLMASGFSEIETLEDLEHRERFTRAIKV